MPSRRSYLAALCSTSVAIAGCGSRRANTEERPTRETDSDNSEQQEDSTPVHEDTPVREGDRESKPDDSVEEVETVLDIRDVGATVDGETDDTQAIRRAIFEAEDGDTVYFPAGTTVISSEESEYNTGILIKSETVPSNLTLLGEGKESVIRLAGDQRETHSVIRLVGEESFDSLSINQMRIDGNRETQIGSGGHGILMYNSEGVDKPADVRLNDVWVENVTQSGITTRRGGITINSASIRNCGLHGINIGNSASFSEDVPPVIVNWTYCAQNGKGKGTYGINCSGGNILVQDCICRNNGQGTKTTSNSINVSYRRVILEKNDHYGYTRAGSSTEDRSNVVFDDVIAVENGAGGFRLADDTDYHVPTNIVASHNFGDNILLLNNASIQAERVWSNRAENAYGMSVGSDPTGQIRQYYHFRNEQGPLEGGGEVNVRTQQRRDRTELETVPALWHVGAKSSRGREFCNGSRRHQLC